MANNVGTLVGAPIRPFAQESVFAAAFADELKGGLHIVANDVSRNIMPSWYLQDGMVVSVLNSAEAGGQRASYQYNSAGDPSWEAFGAGVAIDGSNNVFSLFDGAGNLKNSFFKQAGTNEFTVANGTSHLRIFSGETSGDIHIKTVNNGSADFYLDPRNGIINIGRDQTNADVYLRANGSLSTINMHIQSSGSGYVQLDGSVKFSSKVPEVSTHNVLYFNSSTYEVTYGAAPSGGSGVSSLSALLDVSIKDPSYGHVLVYDPSMLNDGKWRNVAPIDASLNFVTNASLANYVLKAGDTMTGDLIINTSLNVHDIFVPLNDDIKIHAGDTLTGSDPGNVYIIAGNNNSTVTAGGGSVYISPGREYSSGGSHTVGSVYIGNPSYNYTTVRILPAGESSYMSLSLQAKGSGTIYMGSSGTSNTTVYGNFSVNNGGSNIFDFATSSGKLTFDASNNSITCGAGDFYNNYAGKHLSISAGKAYSYGAYHGDGGNLTILAGNADSSIALNNGGNFIIGVGKGINGGADGSLYIRYIKETTASKVLYYNPDVSSITYGDAPGTYASFNYKTTDYTVTTADLNNIVEASGTITIYFPTNLTSGFQTTVVNVGPGIVTLSASTGATMFMTDASNDLRDRYAAASAVYKGGNVWYAFGNLK